MKRRVFMAMLALSATLHSLASGAGTNYVANGASQTPPFDSWATAATNLQAAIDYASTNLALYDTVLVSNGAFNIGAEILITNAITVKSLSGWSTTTVRRTTGTVRVFHLQHAGAVLDGFTVRDGSSGGSSGGGIYIDAGTVRNCLVTNCYNNGGAGGGIYMLTGLVENCTLANNSLGWGDGGGVCMLNGTVRNCIISRCKTSGSGANWGGGGILVNGGNCVIRNCLILGCSALNTGAGKGGGIRRQAGNALIENCTIVGNYGYAGAGGVDSEAAANLILTNCIVRLNDCNVPGDDNVRNVTSGFSCGPSLSGNGNFSGDPQFVANGSGYGDTHVPGNYRLKAASGCLNTGTNLAWSSTASDLDGANRIIGGSTDMGAYELDPNTAALACRFTADQVSGTNSLQTVFTSFVGGSNLVNLAYSWNFGDGQSLSGIGLAVVTNTYGPGLFSVSLSVTNAANEGASQVQSNLIRVLTTATTYCSTNGANTPPYTNWATAASTIQNAIDQGLGLVLVSNGTYGITAEILVSRSNTVQSVNGPTATTVQRTSGISRLFRLTDANAVLDGFTLKNGDVGSYYDGGGVYLTAGTVRNCIITNCQAYNWGGGIYMVTGLVDHCQITKCVLTWGVGGGIYMLNGTVQNCILTKNSTSGSGGSYGGGGIYVGGGTCTIRNNLIMGCTALSGSGGGIKRKTAGIAKVENCTLVGNRAVTSGPGGIDSDSAANMLVTNCIITLNDRDDAGEDNIANATVGYSCSPSLAGNGNIAGPPQFNSDGSGFGTNHIVGDYHLQSASPCIDKGSTNLAWITPGATDLDGSNRVMGASVDMGAYEANVAALPLGCNFTVSTNRGVESVSVTFTATVSGGNTNGVAYLWAFGDGGTDAGTDKVVVSHSYGPGLYTVVLRATNGVNESATNTLTPPIRVTTYATTYCATNGTQTPPYTNWPTAATNLQEAIDQGEALVQVGPGTYGIVNVPISIIRSNTVQGIGGWSNTVVRRLSGSTRIFVVNHANAVLDGLTLCDGNLSGSGDGGGIYLGAGTVRNCLVTNCTGQNAGGIFMSTGLVENCTISGNTCAWGAGGGIYMCTGTVQNCILSKNKTSALGGGLDGGGGIVVRGGTCLIRNCLVVGCTASDVGAGRGGGIRRATSGKAIVENCTVVGNKAYVGPGGIDSDSAVNMLVTNCIVYLNDRESAGEDDLANALAGYSCSPNLLGPGNVTNDPLFLVNGTGYGTNHVPGNYRLQTASPCVNGATNLAWMIGATDLDGVPRVQTGKPDMGAYETYVAPRGAVFTMR